MGGTRIGADMHLRISTNMIILGVLQSMQNRRCPQPNHIKFRGTDFTALTEIELGCETAMNVGMCLSYLMYIYPHYQHSCETIG